MLAELRSDLEAIYSKVKDAELVSRVIENLSTINVTKATTDRTLVADLFYATLVAIQEMGEETLQNKVFKAFDNISQIAQSGEESASLLLINFLNDLYQHRSGSYSQINISADEAIVLLKDLEPIKFVFLLCDEKGERYFPANRLLSNIVFDQKFISSKIEPYHINMLQLAVEMFKITGDDDPQKQLEQLINECNLEFIKYLDGTAIRIDTLDMVNYQQNNVMVFYNELEKKVLIRHERESYFQNLPAGVVINHEKSSQDVVIGHYVELPVNGKAIDYSLAITENPLELLDLVYSRECKNVLIEKMILKTDDGIYQPLNPFCSKDKYVVKGQLNRNRGKSVAKDHFIDCLDECKLQMFYQKPIFSGINQISFGLCAYLLEKEIVDLEKMFSSINVFK